MQCQSGARSAIATSLLRARGIEAINLVGGFAGWQAGGYPVERGQGAKGETLRVA
jgi:hydroxyacylglutathione hydrolase